MIYICTKVCIVCGQDGREGHGDRTWFSRNLSSEVIQIQNMCCAGDSLHINKFCSSFIPKKDFKNSIMLSTANCQNYHFFFQEQTFTITWEGKLTGVGF